MFFFMFIMISYKKQIIQQLKTLDGPIMTTNIEWIESELPWVQLFFALADSHFNNHY